jgi:hypothetical protein
MLVLPPATPMNRALTGTLVTLVQRLAIVYRKFSLLVVQPIGAVPEGRTLVITTSSSSTAPTYAVI